MAGLLLIVHATYVPVQVGEMQDSLDAMNLSIVQTPLEHYPFAVGQSSTKLAARKPGDKTTTFAIGSILYMLNQHTCNLHARYVHTLERALSLLSQLVFLQRHPDHHPMSSTLWEMM